MKRVIIAPDSFKQTLSAVQVCEIVSEQLKQSYPDIHIDCVPVADGGEGTVDAFLFSVGGEKVYSKVKSPLGNDITAYYGILPDGSAIIEMAQASGIATEKANDPLKSSTYGTGQLILHAVKNGAEKIYIGIGGSATTDGGTGCLSALGVKFTKEKGEEIPLGGEGLPQIKNIDISGLDEDVRNCTITVLCDVKNPLYGKNGAAYIYAPQKGADEEQVKFLDKGLMNLAEKAEECLGCDYSSLEGAGAAGGLGFGLVAFLGAQLKRGVDTVLEATGFEAKAQKADLVITGEGKMDAQSLMGKVPFGVASKSIGTKVIAIVGVSEVDTRQSSKYGIEEIIETNPLHLPFEKIKHNARQMLTEACAKISL